MLGPEVDERVKEGCRDRDRERDWFMLPDSYQGREWTMRLGVNRREKVGGLVSDRT